ncbi:MAG: hypothetical protein C4294_11280 [Nitrospiraceae bacterium]
MLILKTLGGFPGRPYRRVLRSLKPVRVAGQMERVSVIIPTYNQAQFLAEAIESAVGQSLPPDEILIIDNDSTDNTAEIAARYPQARYVHQPDQGSCGSTNRGIRDATGYYVVILHSDDRLLPHHLETSSRAFQAHPEAAFVCGDYRWFGAEGTWHVHRCRSLITMARSCASTSSDRRSS